MKIEKRAIYLSAEEMVELEDITLNDDEQAALIFLKRLKKKIDLLQRQQCGAPLAKGE